jgi:hypothetical protein
VTSLRVASLSGFLALALLPLVFDMGCADPVLMPKFACWLVAGGLACMTCTRALTAAEKALWLWWLWGVVSSLYNGVAPAWVEMLSILAGLLWARSEMPRRDLWLALGFALTVFYSWVQRLGLDPFHWSDPNLSVLRTIAGLGNPNYLAMYLACLFPWVWTALYRRGPIGWTLAFVSMLTLQLTATRGSLLVLTGIFLLALAVSMVRHRGLTRFWLVGSLLLVLSWGTSLRASGQRQFALASSMVSLGSGKDYSVQARKLLWQSAWKAGLEHPFLGVGWGHFGDAYLANRAQEPDVLLKRSRRPEDPHNQPLRVLSETGWVGLGFWAAWALLALRAQWRRGLGPELACLLILLGNGLTNCYTLAVLPLMMLWSTPERDSPVEKPLQRKGLPVVLLALAFGLAGWAIEHCFWWDDEWALRARALPREAPELTERRLRALAAAELYCPPWLRISLVMKQSAAWQELARLSGERIAWQKSVEYALAAVRKDPKNSFHWRFLARTYEQAGDLQAALSAWKEAGLRDPLSPAVYYFMARTQHSMGDSAGALQSLGRSLELFSNSRQVYQFRAQIMIEQGRTWEGIEDWVDSQVIDEGI